MTKDLKEEEEEKKVICHRTEFALGGKIDFP